MFGLSVLIGPAIGGLITDTVGWPFVFFFNLPVGALVFFMVWRYLPLYHLAGERPRIDYLGAALFTAALVPILVGLTNKGSADWSDPFVGGLIGLGALILVLFLIVESRSAEPIVPLELFRNRSFSISVAAMFLAAFGFFATVVFLPRWFQVVAGSSATVSGYQMLPLLGGLIFSAVASGQIVSRTGRYRVLMFVALALMAVGLFMLSHLHADTPIPVLWAWMFVTGLGVGPTFAVFTLIVQNNVPVERLGHGDQQPDLLPAGRRHGRPRADGDDLRDEPQRRAAAPARRGRRPARGRWRAGRFGRARLADRRRRPRRGDPGGDPGRGTRRGRAVRAGDRRRHPCGVVDRHLEHVRDRHRGERRGGRARPVPARGAGAGDRAGAGLGRPSRRVGTNAVRDLNGQRGAWRPDGVAPRAGRPGGYRANASNGLRSVRRAISASSMPGRCAAGAGTARSGTCTASAFRHPAGPDRTYLDPGSAGAGRRARRPGHRAIRATNQASSKSSLPIASYSIQAPRRAISRWRLESGSAWVWIQMKRSGVSPAASMMSS